MRSLPKTGRISLKTGNHIKTKLLYLHKHNSFALCSESRHFGSFTTTGTSICLREARREHLTSDNYYGHDNYKGGAIGATCCKCFVTGPPLLLWNRILAPDWFIFLRHEKKGLGPSRQQPSWPQLLLGWCRHLMAG